MAKAGKSSIWFFKEDAGVPFKAQIAGLLAAKPQVDVLQELHSIQLCE